MKVRTLHLAEHSTTIPGIMFQHAAPIARAAPVKRRPYFMPQKMVTAFVLLIIAATLLLLSACGAAGTTGTTAPALTPQITVFTVKATYEGALTGMTAYARLPRCTPANTPVCSSQPVLDQLERARVTARSAIDSAEGAVRTPGFGSDMLTTAVAAADAATKALTAITNGLPKPK